MRVVEMVAELRDTYNAKVDVLDSWIDKNKAKAVYYLDLIGQPALASYDAIIVAVSHC